MEPLDWRPHKLVSTSEWRWKTLSYKVFFSFIHVGNLEWACTLLTSIAHSAEASWNLFHSGCSVSSGFKPAIQTEVSWLHRTRQMLWYFFTWLLSCGSLGSSWQQDLLQFLLKGFCLNLKTRDVDSPNDDPCSLKLREATSRSGAKWQQENLKSLKDFTT